ncbi:hypothetical protein B1F73_15150 [Pseudomonas syringae]|uniref:hypothetical protein n=1 Tax=Pseudomonas TaxID=286 RepID=UPI00088C0AAF|nr:MULTISPECIES: hypothetical protein [Pseudomonas]NAP01974.1 hypothetical protein [Pseudomonas syringae]NAP22497.1 hypothetical protein [Pseudomonas syringae]NAP48566.1 hypothetical protein [Pseudomonas syringae]NAP82552.1 hypothetical protein [Pseudomonas syringae]NAQ13488.1 hypothetical protein [Pseudomonas syringae]
MGAALSSYEFYDYFPDEPESNWAQPALSFFVNSGNVDVSIDTATYQDQPDTYVYTGNRTHGRITIMSAFRKDLFVSVTLPVLIAAIASVSVGWAAYAHIDTKLDAARADSSSSVDHLGDTLRIELRADRDARAKEFEALRLEMREDRKDTRDAIKELINRS